MSYESLRKPLPHSKDSQCRLKEKRGGKRFIHHKQTSISLQTPLFQGPTANIPPNLTLDLETKAIRTQSTKSVPPSLPSRGLRILVQQQQGTMCIQSVSKHGIAPVLLLRFLRFQGAVLEVEDLGLWGIGMRRTCMS